MYQKIHIIGVIKPYRPLKDKLWGEKSALLIKICQHEPHSRSPVCTRAENQYRNHIME